MRKRKSLCKKMMETDRRGGTRNGGNGIGIGNEITLVGEGQKISGKGLHSFRMLLFSRSSGEPLW